ncbi:FdtA/QdtA family cupin domain-containing protein [uncultured Christiangramia sp.]|uniref:sugar 3,4-ketoisomerase n=1 Tax=uncultured Christiangramia sp. TaxID=503836 RepID=UPI00262D3565|nr:FdtA/QdtA family cupin domain-containing protein [uncultured Christiangramia sp.]
MAKNWKVFTLNEERQNSLKRISIDNLNVEFEINRVFYMFDVPESENRGRHAHHSGWQVLIALQGSFEISLYDGHISDDFIIKDLNKGLLISPMVWRELRSFSSDAICLVLNTEKYDEKNTIRSFEEFKHLVRNPNNRKS